MKVKEIISLVLICTMTLVLGTTTFALERSEPTGIVIRQMCHSVATNESCRFDVQPKFIYQQSKCR